MKKTVFIIFSLLFSSSAIYTQTWEFVGLDSLVILHLNINADTIYAGAADLNNNPNINSGLYYSDDGGNNWVQLDSLLGDGAILGLERNIDNAMYIIKCPCLGPQAATLYKTIDNGQSWEPINNISSLGIRWFGISPFNPNEMYAFDVSSVAGGVWNSLYRSTDSGVNWDNLGPFPGSSHGSEISFAFDLTDSMSLYVTVYTVFDRYLFKSTNKGDSWFFVSTPPAVASEIHTDYFLPGRIYLYAFPQYISNNGGINWLRADSGLSVNSGFISFYQDRITTSLLYNLRTDGLYNSKRDYIFWTKIKGSEYLPLVFPTQVDNLKNILIDDITNQIYLGTSEGLFRQNILTNIINNESPYIINGFVLEQNFPNPFNPNTIIKYNLPITTHVVLKVYDLLGNELTVLVDEEKPAGSYEINFNGENLASGVYIYRVIARKNGSVLFTDTKRMILIK